jgi:hypothetical protein
VAVIGAWPPGNGAINCMCHSSKNFYRCVPSCRGGWVLVCVVYGGGGLEWPFGGLQSSSHSVSIPGPGRGVTKLSFWFPFGSCVCA